MRCWTSGVLRGLDAGERISIGVQGTAGKGLSQSNLMADSLRPP
ncbi:hypothetical protein HMPREF1979_00784 [Actinomyces johnsonii F0542]|uniref:Uncharacterized protein n=1 Tax=Actinomyces johnsonii F0542 TaxID=1321818 RepID=U1QU76_9ACTO|nr:hypothetical protein HMPREF1979_00784 [Actinomyces johnsonii F0542]